MQSDPPNNGFRSFLRAYGRQPVRPVLGFIIVLIMILGTYVAFKNGPIHVNHTSQGMPSPDSGRVLLRRLALAPWLDARVMPDVDRQHDIEGTRSVIERYSVSSCDDHVRASLQAQINEQGWTYEGKQRVYDGFEGTACKRGINEIVFFRCTVHSARQILTIAIGRRTDTNMPPC